MAKPPLKKVERRPLASLKVNPLQSVFFDDLSDHDVKALAANIRRNGLENRIVVMPDGMILRGHQRLRALKLNGETETDVLVRYDLVEADPAILERLFLEENIDRRQLDKLGQARAALRIYEIEKKKPRGRLYEGDFAEARDRVGRAIGMSGRTLFRYFRILRTPTTIQNAFRAGKLSLVMAEKIADLDPEIQRKIANRIIAGEPAHQVVGEYLAPGSTREPSVADLVNGFARDLRNRFRPLAAVAGLVGPSLVAKHRTTFEAARDVIQKMLDQK